jgi:predicted permease
MAALARFFSRVINVLRPRRAEVSLARELASHLSLLEDDYRRGGMSEDDARRAARLTLGGVEQTKELHRDERSFRWVDDGRRDVSYAFRMLRRSPVVTATAMLSLAIGLGASTAIFSVGNALLFRRPPGIAEADRLVDIGISRGDGGFNPASFPTYVDVRDRANSFAGVYARQMFPMALSVRVAGSAGTSERIFGQFVTPNYFGVLGVTPTAGTLFGPAAVDAPGASPFVVLGHAYWTNRFNGNRAVVGQAILVNGLPFTVVGIAPKAFYGTAVMAADLWLPLNMFSAATGQSETIFTNRENGWLVMGARLKPNVSVAAAAAEVNALAQDLAREYASATAAKGLQVLPSSSLPGNRATVAIFFALLMGMVSLVVLVACANVSGILLARASARRREIAVRLSLGADRARVVRQLLTETAVLFVLAGAAGLVLARIGTAVLVSRLPALPFPLALSLPFDSPVVAFTLGLSLLAAFASGLAPALQASKAQPVAALKDSHGPSHSRLRQAFVIAQVAFSVALVVGAGLFARALARAGAVDPGFNPRGVELTSIDISMAGYTDATGPAFWRSLVEGVRALPGIQGATVARVVPGGFEGIGLGLGVPGGHSSADDFEADGNIVEPGYFATLGIPLVAGRDFSAADTHGAEPVAIVGEAAARHFWPGQNALGKYLSQPIKGGTRNYVVVGVAADIKSTSLVDGMSQSFVYLPLHQAYASHLTSSMTLVTRTQDGRGVAPAIRQLVTSLSPNLPTVTFRTLEDSVALGLVPQRVALSLSSSLGAVGLLLAAIGIYGVTAFMVTRRLREFAIRIALGARRADIVRIVLRQGLGLTVIGCVVGVMLAGAAAGVLSTFLLGIPALDPTAFGGAVALFATAGAAACYGPLRRATGIDLVASLRCD